MGVGLAVIKWPLLFSHQPWGLAEGTKECPLIAMSVLALLGSIRYPLRMLPILLFEVSWKLLRLAVVALPLWSDNQLVGATRTQAGAVLWVVVIIAVIPWRHVLAQYLLAPGEPGAAAGRRLPADVSADHAVGSTKGVAPRSSDDRPTLQTLDFCATLMEWIVSSGGIAPLGATGSEGPRDARDHFDRPALVVIHVMPTSLRR